MARHQFLAHWRFLNPPVDTNSLEFDRFEQTSPKRIDQQKSRAYRSLNAARAESETTAFGNSIPS